MTRLGHAAIRIVKVLRGAGFQSLLAGGCVRDMLLHRPAKDYDVATDAGPAEVMRLFKRTLKVGAKFGVVIVLLEDHQVEVATFRSDAGYVDGRRPTQVRFTTAEQDALRRDFTVNGMFYDPIERQVIDYVGGHEDLVRRVIRTIGHPSDRFSEDYLRMLRAVRFSTQLGFSIDPATYQALCDHAAKIVRISGERICIELEGILTSPDRHRGGRLLWETGLGPAIFPGLRDDQSRLGLEVVSCLPRKAVFPLVLSALLEGLEMSSAMEKLGVLKLSRRQVKHIRFLFGHRGILMDEAMSLADLKFLLAGPYFEDLYQLHRAMRKATGAAMGPLMKLRRRVKALGDVELRPKPILDGNDLMRMGIAPGPGLGQLAEQLYRAQLEGQVNTPEQARQWVAAWISGQQGGASLTRRKDAVQ